jgi:hypothetical protein
MEDNRDLVEDHSMLSYSLLTSEESALSLARFSGGTIFCSFASRMGFLSLADASLSHQPLLSSWELALPLYSKEGQVQVGLGFWSMVFRRQCRRVLPRRGWTSVSSCREESEEL